MDGRTHNFPCILQGIVPFGRAAAQKPREIEAFRPQKLVSFLGLKSETAENRASFE